jgi:DnaJ-class molecular chaperone
LTNLYDLLDTHSEASHTELRRAFRAAARSWHPDVNRSVDASERFRAIHEAWQVLGDARLRAAYDAGLFRSGSVTQRSRAPRNVVFVRRRPLAVRALLGALSWLDLRERPSRVR